MKVRLFKRVDLPVVQVNQASVEMTEQLYLMTSFTHLPLTLFFETKDLPLKIKHHLIDIIEF